MSFNKYPYTDFHEMNDDWVIAKVKELIAAWSQVRQDWETQQQAFADLKEFVETYFENLDVQQEINHKLDEMAEDGSLTALLDPIVASKIGDVVADQIGSTVAGQIGSTVAGQLPDVVSDQLPDAVAGETGSVTTAWLNEHVDPVGSAVIVDDTLTISGAAADSKTVGDIVNIIKELNSYSYPILLEDKTLYGVTLDVDTMTISCEDAPTGRFTANLLNDYEVTPGQKICVEFLKDGTNTDEIYIGIFAKYHTDGSWGSGTYINDHGVYTVPEGKDRLLFRIQGTEAHDVAFNIHFQLHVTNRFPNPEYDPEAYMESVAAAFDEVKANFIDGDPKTPHAYGISSMNDLLFNNIMLIDSGYVYTDKPSGMGAGFILNAKTGNFRLQLAWQFNGGKMWKRRGDATGTTWESWQNISGGGDVTNEYTFNEYSNTYNISSSPEITTDTNAFLASTGDSTDRTADIVTMLTTYGVCHLGYGEFYVNNLEMPNGTSIVGTGYGTKIILSGSSAGFAIKPQNYCIVRDVCIVGSTGSITLRDVVGNRHGILWQGNYTQDPTSGNQPMKSIISNVWINRFTGGGITCYDTGYGTYNNLEVVNAYIADCGAGINVSYWSEFHKFTNVRTQGCYYGCINNGGNNVFVNCDFSTCKLAFLMDNSQSQSQNNSHGSCVGCVFNHTDENTGIGIKVLNCKNGFIFDGCQIFFSRIYLENSDGIVVSGCNFGSVNTGIMISGGNTILFANNMHQTDPSITISGNTKTHFVNCYNRATGELITA